MIVVATDGSAAAKAAVELGCRLARALEQRLVFVSAWATIRGSYGLPYGSLATGDIFEAEHEEARKALADAARAADEAGLSAETVEYRGDPAHAIVGYAAQHAAAMIVIGSHGWGAVGRAVFGSVSQGVIRNAPCPVTVVRDHYDQQQGLREALTG